MEPTVHNLLDYEFVVSHSSLAGKAPDQCVLVSFFCRFFLGLLADFL